MAAALTGAVIAGCSSSHPRSQGSPRGSEASVASPGEASPLAVTSGPAGSADTGPSPSTDGAASATPSVRTVTSPSTPVGCAQHLLMGLQNADLMATRTRQRSAFAAAVGSAEPETTVFGSIVGAFDTAAKAKGRAAALSTPAYQLAALTKRCATGH